MRKFKIKSFCKINLSLRVIKKLSNGFHNISSLITFCDLHDTISISQIKKNKDIISFSGKFKKGINKKLNTITRTLDLLRRKKILKNYYFKINIKKNIPHGSGLGGGSSNAASLLKYLNYKMNFKLSKKKIETLSSKIGFDVPINLQKKNTLLTGKKGKILRISKNFNLYILIVYPGIICSTKKVYMKNKNMSPQKIQPYLNFRNTKNLTNFLINEKNDLESTVTSFHPKVRTVIDVIKSQKGCYFSRITGSGSACFGIFSNMKNTIAAKKSLKLKYPTYWCVTSKTI